MELILTERIQACVKSALSNSSFPEKYKKEAKDIINVELEDSKEHPISLDLLRQLPKLTDVYLHELMKGSGVYIKPKPVKTKNPEFEAYMEKLRQEQKEREYAQMVESAITSKDEKFNLGIQPDDIKEIKTHIISICNILFSMAAVFAACYKAAQSMVNDYGLQILIGLSGAAVIGIVEGILYTKYAFDTTKVDKRKKKKKHRITTL